LDALPKSIDVGKYTFVFEVSLFSLMHKGFFSSAFASVYDKLKLLQMVLHDPDHLNLYATGGQTRIPIFVTGVVKVDSAEISVLDSDLGSTETKKYFFTFPSYKSECFLTVTDCDVGCLSL
jgi:oligosaccharyltransferase complex subunit delta (ribophorin II)